MFQCHAWSVCIAIVENQSPFPHIPSGGREFDVPRKALSARDEVRTLRANRMAGGKTNGQAWFLRGAVNPPCGNVEEKGEAVGEGADRDTRGRVCSPAKFAPVLRRGFGTPLR